MISLIFTIQSCGNERKPFKSQVISEKNETALLIKKTELTGQELFNSILDTISLKHLDAEILTKSRWKFNPFENCISYYSFKENGIGELYSCEREWKYEIKYQILNDTLLIEEFDNPTEDNPENKIVKVRDDKFIYNGKSLILIGSTLYNMGGISWTPDIELVIEYKGEQ